MNLPFLVPPVVIVARNREKRELTYEIIALKLFHDAQDPSVKSPSTCTCGSSIHWKSSSWMPTRAQPNHWVVNNWLTSHTIQPSNLPIWLILYYILTTRFRLHLRFMEFIWTYSPVKYRNFTPKLFRFDVLDYKQHVTVINFNYLFLTLLKHLLQLIPFIGWV